MARYLVTGAAGFIGANLVARLVSQGHEVRGVDVKTTPERAHLYEQGEFQVRDLRETGQADFAIEGCDAVYHLAADHGGAGYFHGPADYKAAENNLLIDQNVRKAAVSSGARLFFASSACTYPTTIQGKGARALKESDWGGGPAEASYGEAKRMSTVMFEAARDHGHDFRCGIFHTIYGPTQDTEEPRAKFPTAICRKILEAGRPVDISTFQDAKPRMLKPTVEIWGDGSQVRTFLYIEDALDKIQMVMNKPYLGPVNIGSDEEVTVQECSEWAAEAVGASPEWVYNHDMPRGVEHRASDNTVWMDRYGPQPLTSAKDGFAKLMLWMAENA